MFGAEKSEVFKYDELYSLLTRFLDEERNCRNKQNQVRANRLIMLLLVSLSINHKDIVIRFGALVNALMETCMYKHIQGPKSNFERCW